MKWHLFIESGGTGSSLLAKGENGQILTWYRVGGFKAARLANTPLLIREIQSTLDFKKGDTIERIDWGISGLISQELKSYWETLFQGWYPFPIRLYPDYLTSYFAKFSTLPGHILILGTGSVWVSLCDREEIPMEPENLLKWEFGDRTLFIQKKLGKGRILEDIGSAGWFGFRTLQERGISPQELEKGLKIPQRIDDLSGWSQFFPSFLKDFQQNKPFARALFEECIEKLLPLFPLEGSPPLPLLLSGGVLEALPELGKRLLHQTRYSGPFESTFQSGPRGAEFLSRWEAKKKGVCWESFPPDTERENSEAHLLSHLSPVVFSELMITEEEFSIQRLKTLIPSLGELISRGVQGVKKGGRIFYVGAGTSGRLGILDASEIPPTFGQEGVFTGVIAGGEAAVFSAVEGAEDNLSSAKKGVKTLNLKPEDIIVGIAASGRTPFTLTFLKEAKKRVPLCSTALICCSPPQRLQGIDHLLYCPTGPEILSGSTRLKAGTATKIVLNAFSTGIMVGLGKTYHNDMVDLQASNLKLKTRSLKLLQKICQLSPSQAEEALQRAQGKLKCAILMSKLGLNLQEAEQRLLRSEGILHNIFK